MILKSVLQGDHLGVEFGISAHAGLLTKAGLLTSSSRLVADRLVRPSEVHEGLVIDDFFSVAHVPVQQLYDSFGGPVSNAKESFDKAKNVYSQVGLSGSDPKDIVEAHVATVSG